MDARNGRAVRFRLLLFVLHVADVLLTNGSTRRPKRPPHFAIMKRLLTLLIDHPSAWAFASPVNAAEVTDYYDVIKQPMGMSRLASSFAN